jgi:hypothetical protein
MMSGRPLGLPSSVARPCRTLRVHQEFFSLRAEPSSTCRGASPSNYSDQTTPEGCVEGYHLHRTRFERIAERKLRRRQLTDDCQH